MKQTQDDPRWLQRARNRWPKDSAPPGLDARWSRYWIKRFLVYLERRNGGSLPERAPAYGIVESFDRFLASKWQAEDWKRAQARAAVEWLLNAASEGPGKAAATEAEAADLPIRPKVALEAPRLPPLDQALALASSAAGLGDMVRARCRKEGKALRTEKTYAQWAGRLTRWWARQEDPSYGISDKEEAVRAAQAAMAAFLDSLAVEEDVAASTQRQALNALVFCFRCAFDEEPGALAEFQRARSSKNLPVVLTKGEARRLMDCIEPGARLIAKLLYGSGMRIIEGLRPYAST